MNAVRGAILNQLLRELPDGYVVDTNWLRRCGVSASSTRDYMQRGWLERIGPRLYRRGPPVAVKPVRWEAAILSLQNLMAEPVHVGGLTALELAGYWQYAILGTRSLWIYSDSRRTRSILQRLTLDATPSIRSMKLFSKPELGVEMRALDLVTTTLGPPADQDAAAPSHHQMLRISSLERAILEVLDEVPRTVSFAHASELFEGLTTLRPKLAVALLQACRSVKAKRLFLYFSSQHNYSWVRSIKRAEVDIGAGKRQIVEGGQLDPTYLITVPRDRRRRRAADKP